MGNTISVSCKECKQNTDLKSCCWRQINATNPTPAAVSNGILLASAFNQEKFSDVKLYLGRWRHPLYAHRLVLDSKSLHFQKAFDSSMREASDREFFFPDDEFALWRTFQFLYMDFYDESFSEIWRLSHGVMRHDPIYCRHSRVCRLAKYFGIKELETYSYKRLSEELKDSFDVEEFVECVTEIFDEGLLENEVCDDSPTLERSSPDSHDLENLILEAAAKNFKKLNKNPSFRRLLRSGGEFAVGLAGKLGQS